MDADFLAGTRRAQFYTLLRFCIVGGASTLVFLATSWLLIWLELMPATLVNVAAMAAGIASSYSGHYYFTYRKGGGQHAFFGPRFFAVTAILGTASVVFTHVTVENFRVSPYIVSTLVSILYPVGSLLLHHFWTFARVTSVPSHSK
jgi:putative flippase GtrA